MTSSFLIGFPDIPFNYSGTTTNTYSTTSPFENTITGTRANVGELATAMTGSHFVQHTASSACNYVSLARASVLRGSKCTTYTLRGSDTSFTHPSSISGLQLWLDMGRGVTNSSTQITQVNDLSSNAYNMSQSAGSNAPIWTRADNRENLVTYSEEFDNAAWTKTRSSVSANSIANPYDGQTTADTLVEDGTASNTHIILPVATFQVQTAFTYRISVYAKKKDRHISLRFDCTASGFTSQPYAHFNLDTGTVSSVTGSVTASITDMGKGWFRCIAECPCAANDTAKPTVLLASTAGTTSYNGDGTSGTYIFGFQFQPAVADSNYVQAVANPVFRGQNAWRGMHCNGSQYVGINVGSPPPSNLRLTGDFTFFVAVYPDTTLGFGLTNFHMFGCENNNASGYMFRLQPTDGALYVTALCRTNQAGTSSGVTSSTNIPVRQVSILGFVKSGTTGTHYLNGTANGSGTCNNAVSPTQTFYVGQDFSTQPFKGTICEVLIYNTALGTRDRQAVEAYLTAKWQTAPLYTKHLADLETLSGPSGEDAGSIFNSVTKTYYIQQFDSYESSKRTVSKVYFGNAFDFDREPLRGRLVRKELNQDKGKRQAHMFEFRWSGITNDKRIEFQNKIGRYGNESPVFIMYSSYSDQLLSYSPIHCKIISYTFTPKPGKLNDVLIMFEELV